MANENKNIIPLTESQLFNVVTEGIKRVLSEIDWKTYMNEISAGLLGRAAAAAHRDMMQNWNDSKVRGKRERQWKNFSKERIRMDAEEKNSVCPSVPESELANMPRNTYVIMDGDGRDAISADFRMRYSGHAGTMEQCEEYVKRFYDENANWEYLPSILSLEEYFKYKHNNK